MAIFLNFGQFGRRQALVRFVATGHPLAQPAPPVAPSGPCGAAQLLTFDQRPPEHKKHFITVAFPAAELAAGDSFHLRQPINHPKDRLGLAVPSPPLDAREALPFVDGDHRSPAPVG